MKKFLKSKGFLVTALSISCGGVGVAEHVDIELHVAGEDVFHPVACYMERKTDIPYPLTSYESSFFRFPSKQ